MIHPYHKWLRRLLDKQVVINVVESDGRRGTYTGRLVHVDKDSFVVVDRDCDAAINLIQRIDDISTDEKNLKIKTKVKIKECTDEKISAK